VTVIRRKASDIWKGNTKKLFATVYDNGLGWRLKHCEEPYEVLDGLDVVKYIKFKRLQQDSHIRMGITRQKRAELNVSWKNTCGKTTAKMGRQEEITSALGYLEGNY
jgi:hypothetical protein